MNKKLKKTIFSIPDIRMQYFLNEPVFFYIYAIKNLLWKFKKLYNLSNYFLETFELKENF